MKLILNLTLLIIAATSLAQGQTGGGKADHVNKSERELRELEVLRSRAIKEGDMKTLNAIYADDFAGIVGSGEIINKEQLMSVFKRNDPSLAFSTDEISVRTFGQTAIFTGRLMGRRQDGKVVFASRFTHVFVRRAGRWKCVAGQSTAIAKP